MAANGDLPGMTEGQPRFLDRFSKGAKVGLFALGFFLSFIGIFIAWAIGHRKKMMECSAEAIWYAIIGCSTSGICAWIAYATGLWPDCWLFSLFGPGITVWAGLWLACFICFIFLSVLWIYGLRTKMSDPERAYVMKGDDHFAPARRRCATMAVSRSTRCRKRSGPICSRQDNRRAVGIASSALNAFSRSTSPTTTIGKSIRSGRIFTRENSSGFIRPPGRLANG